MNTLTADILPANPSWSHRCFNTGRVSIGIAHIPRQNNVFSGDAVKLQAAFLEPRTAEPAGAVRRLAAVVWGWL